jgi:tripartite-type tricarboxylate transporter receptor subunit TctC
MPYRVPRRAALALPFASALQAHAQGDWRPNHGVRILVPAAPGGTTDIMARILADHLQPRWGQPVVVENKSGAGGTIGTMEVVRAPADGHHILMGNIGPQSIAYSLFRNLPYTPQSLLPVSGMIRGPNALIVHPSVPANTVPEFVRHLKDNPGRLSYGTPGLGQSPHLSGVWFHQLTGTPGTAVHFRGAAPMLTALVGNTVQYCFDNLTTALAQVRAGRVRALAVTSAERSPQMPDMPALRETMPELAGYDVSTWFGAFLPAGSPAEAVAALNAGIETLIRQPTTRTRFTEMGGEPFYGTPAAFADFVRAEIEKWGTVIRREGLETDLA